MVSIETPSRRDASPAVSNSLLIANFYLIYNHYICNGYISSLFSTGPEVLAHSYQLFTGINRFAFVTPA